MNELLAYLAKDARERIGSRPRFSTILRNIKRGLPPIYGVGAFSCKEEWYGWFESRVSGKRKNVVAIDHLVNGLN